MSWGKLNRKNISIGMLAMLFIGSWLLSGSVDTSYAASKATVKSETKKVTVSGRTFTVQTVTIPKGTPVTLGLAKGQVGATQNFNAIVKAYGAQAAINGAFFEAYGGPTDSYGNLIVDGRVAHIGRYGTTIGFKTDGSVLMDNLYISITGKVTGTKGRSQSWYATFVNRTPAVNASNSILFTQDRGARVGFKGGIAVVIVDGKVKDIMSNNNVAIPPKGYVIVYSGTQKSMADRFEIGATVEMNVAYKDPNGKSIPWEDVVTAVGAGPRLVKDGKVSLSPAGEGFQDQKILSSSAARSGIAVKADGSVMIATVSGATMKQWAEIMSKMGVKQAMNLDGGASSAMYGNGRTITKAGRLLSNTLVFGNSLNK
ncbi:phosphodiester glycosidase family protein [Paenibacillus sp. IHBB 10380]|uniref:phosphodiester glycosidase family protein n=1 Tax=Paenibacillus sp. IHBB 10380 TaxID=1566358 RepID=UPI0005D93654|nr:phosphodiester glycosidase family protein [Paenibacillus sp. IHBB 10380]AJS61575.1 copper amine oxidase [Paenibacillus sp. IHBB 10380]